MIREAITRFIKRVSDLAYQGRNGALIWLGTDRKDTINSGYGDGGKNEEETSAIDIAVGLQNDGNINFKNDLIHVYLSSKTDPDDYFAVTKAEKVVGEPALVLKAPNVYMLSAKRIKIIAGNNSIIMSDSGVTIQSNNIILESDVAEVRCNQSVSLKAPDITFDTNSGTNKRVLTEDDLCVGIDPITGGPIISNFKGPGALVVNQKVKVK